MTATGQTMFEPDVFFSQVLSNFVQISPARPDFSRIEAGRPGTAASPPYALSNPPDFPTVKFRLRRHIKRAGVRAPAERRSAAARTSVSLKKAVNGFE